MQGIVTADREAILTVTVFDANGQEADVDTVLDTGFTDYLTLPQSTINALALSRKGVMQVVLAGGTEVDLAIFQGRVLWYGQTRAIDILAADGGPLLGMSLLYVSRLSMDILDGAAFTLEPLI